jgi:hypothetical protein
MIPRGLRRGALEDAPDHLGLALYDFHVGDDRGIGGEAPLLPILQSAKVDTESVCEVFLGNAEFFADETHPAAENATRQFFVGQRRVVRVCQRIGLDLIGDSRSSLARAFRESAPAFARTSLRIAFRSTTPSGFSAMLGEIDLGLCFIPLELDRRGMHLYGMSVCQSRRGSRSELEFLRKSTVRLLPPPSSSPL